MPERSLPPTTDPLRERFRGILDVVLDGSDERMMNNMSVASGADSVAALSTDLLRTGSEPSWVRWRELLREKGLDPTAIILADMYPDDPGMEFGIVVVPEGRVYEFDFIYGKGDLRTSAATSTIWNWRDRSHDWREGGHQKAVEAGFRLLEAESE
jgi:hypothetical protein